MLVSALRSFPAWPRPLWLLHTCAPQLSYGASDEPLPLDFLPFTRRFSSATPSLYSGLHSASSAPQHSHLTSYSCFSFKPQLRDSYQLSDASRRHVCSHLRFRYFAIARWPNPRLRYKRTSSPYLPEHFLRLQLVRACCQPLVSTGNVRLATTVCETLRSLQQS